jgi:hypothetical protein
VKNREIENPFSHWLSFKRRKAPAVQVLNDIRRQTRPQYPTWTISAPKWNDVALVEKGLHAFICNGSLKFGIGFFVTGKLLVPNNRCTRCVHDLERPGFFMLKTVNAYLNLYAVLRNDPRQAGSNEIRIALTHDCRPKFLTILIKHKSICLAGTTPSITAIGGVDGEVGGVLILRNDNLHGGDSYVYYTGSYECSDGKWQGKMTSQEHTPTTRPVAAQVQHIGFLGTYNDAGAKADAMALVGDQNIRYDATLRLLVSVWVLCRSLMWARPLGLKIEWLSYVRPTAPLKIAGADLFVGNAKPRCTPVTLVYSFGQRRFVFKQGSNRGARLAYKFTLLGFVWWTEAFKMGQFVEEEQYLFQIAADFLKQRTELEKLREAVRLAEAAKALRSKELQRRRVNPKVVDPLAGPQLRA